MREVDTNEEIAELYRSLSAEGQVVRRSEKIEVTALPNGTVLTWRAAATSTPNGAALDINDRNGATLKVHTPKGG